MPGLKKNSTLSYKEKSGLIERNHPEINLSRQTDLMGISRSSIYYQPVVNQEKIEIQNAIDKIYTDYPFYGSRKIKKELENHQIKISRGYVQNLSEIWESSRFIPIKNWD